MATLYESQTAYEATRAFFKGGDKSANKTYETGISATAQLIAAKRLSSGAWLSWAEAEAKIADRNAKAAQHLNDQGVALNNQTPVQFGQARVNGNITYGNCGVMACVALYYATQYPAGIQQNEMWHVTATNENTRMTLTTRGHILMAYKMGESYMTFGHSWAVLGTSQNGQWVVDPWAGLYCRIGEYPQRLKEQLDKWHSHGKRVNVGWKSLKLNQDFGRVMNANDDAILSLVAADAVKVGVRGDGLPGLPG
jgi:hypothetical protein